MEGESKVDLDDVLRDRLQDTRVAVLRVDEDWVVEGFSRQAFEGVLHDNYNEERLKRSPRGSIRVRSIRELHDEIKSDHPGWETAIHLLNDGSQVVELTDGFDLPEHMMTVDEWSEKVQEHRAKMRKFLDGDYERDFGTYFPWIEG